MRQRVALAARLLQRRMAHHPPSLPPCVERWRSTAGASIVSAGALKRLVRHSRIYAEHGLLDHVVHAPEERLSHRQPDGLGGLEVDRQLVPGRLLYGKLARLCPFQDLVHVGSRPAEHVASAYLYAANHDSDTIVTFRVDQGSGKLTPTGHVVKTGSPSTIVFR
jgi:hypothetical protein